MCNERERSCGDWDPRWMSVRREPMRIHLERADRMVGLAQEASCGKGAPGDVLREAQELRDQFAMLILPAQ